MGLEQVIDSIIAEGKRSAQQLRKEGESTGSKLVAEANLRAAALKEKRRTTAKEEGELVRLRELANAELEVSRRRLHMEREVLEGLLERTKARIAVLPEKQDQELLRSLIKANEKGGATIYANARNRLFVQSITSLKYGGDIPCMGGIIVESADRTVRLDLTYDTLLEELIDTRLAKLSQQLFPARSA